jgi:glycerol-3-phosphate acyltransferase PlsY
MQYSSNTEVFIITAFTLFTWWVHDTDLAIWLFIIINYNISVVWFVVCVFLTAHRINIDHLSQEYAERVNINVH